MHTLTIAVRILCVVVLLLIAAGLGTMLWLFTHPTNEPIDDELDEDWQLFQRRTWMDATDPRDRGEQP